MKDGNLTSNFDCYYNEAMDFLDTYQNEKALDSFKQAQSILLSSPELYSSEQHVHLYYYIGRSYLRLERIEEALENFNKAIEYQPHNIEVIDKLGETHFKLHQYEESANYCDQIIKLNPSLIEPYYNKGNILLNRIIANNLGDQEIYKQAIGYYNKALEIELNDKTKSPCLIYTDKKEELPALTNKKMRC